MTITRDQMKSEILVFLNKQNNYQGFFSDDKVNSVIQECVDYLSGEMALGNEGWLTKLVLITTAPGQKSVPIPENVGMIYEARYLFGDTYVPMYYNARWGQPQHTPASAANQFPWSYRIVNNTIYFDPQLATGGTDYLQLEAMVYPDVMTTGTDNLMARLDRCFIHFVKYRACGILVAQMGKSNREWVQYEREWQDRMLEMLYRRNRQTTWIAEFGE